MNVRRCVIAVLFLAVLLLTVGTHRRRQMQQRLADQVSAVDRYVDVLVRLNVVVHDDNGAELVEGKPKMRILRTHVRGGWVDTRTSPPRLLETRPDHNGIERTPIGRDWYVSEDQERIVLHGEGTPLGQLVYGSEGAGKTVALIQWVYMRWMELVGERREIGITAPTSTRIETVTNELFPLFRGWFTYSSSRGIVTLCDGTRLRLVGTYRQSKAQGSPIQGFNWSACARDEGQDQCHVHEDIESRGRAAKNGRYLQLITATAKDDPAWRTLRAVLLSADGGWARRDLSIFRSPFVSASFIADKAKGMTSREFRRRYGDPKTHIVEDLPPENQLYFGWDRTVSLRPIPQVGAKKITSLVLGKKTGDARHALLAGHDPGSLKGATIYLDAYEIRGVADPVWWVRGETLHKRQTTQRSARDVLAFAKAQGLNGRRGDGPIVHVRAMPVGQAEDNPSEDLYRIFRAEGLDVRASQYRNDGTGTGVIKKENRIELVNWLFESGRLFIECDSSGRPVAPKLVESLETIERDHRGKAESGPKDETDLSDCPAALGYALWPFEKSASAALREDIRAGMGVG